MYYNYHKVVQWVGLLNNNNNDNDNKVHITQYKSI